MSPPHVLTLRLNPSLRKRLLRLARATGQRSSFLAREAIREYVAKNDWQIREMEKGIEEANRGDFARERTVRQIMKNWTRPAG